jgi:hypothetical protein
VVDLEANSRVRAIRQKLIKNRSKLFKMITQTYILTGTRIAAKAEVKVSRLTLGLIEVAVDSPAASVVQ